MTCVGSLPGFSTEILGAGAKTSNGRSLKCTRVGGVSKPGAPPPQLPFVTDDTVTGNSCKGDNGPVLLETSGFTWHKIGDF